MKTALLLLPLLALACIAHALPVEPHVASSVDDVGEVRTEDEWLLRAVGDEAVAVPGEDTPATEEAVRERRSPRGWQPGRGGGFPQPQPRPQQPRGHVTGGVHRERGVGTVVHAQGQGNVWTSRDGRSRVDAHGDWSKVVRGPAKGKPSYNVGVQFEHRF